MADLILTDEESEYLRYLLEGNSKWLESVIELAGDDVPVSLTDNLRIFNSIRDKLRKANLLG